MSDHAAPVLQDAAITAPAVSTALPERLRLDTRELHHATERSRGMAALLAGRLSRHGYCTLLRNLHALYTALEAALQCSRHDAAVALLQAGPLQRAGALGDDLHSLHGPDWAAALPLLPATAAYVQRLQALAADEPPLLVAHAYVRYLGDLHGGQVLKRLVQRHYTLAGDDGTHFYDFGDEDEVLRLRGQLRDALGRLPLSAAQQDAVVDEARWAFMQHQQLFEQLPG